MALYKFYYYYYYYSDGKLFHTAGPETEKARLPNFVLVLTVTADLAVDERSRVRLGESNKVVKVCRTTIVKDIVHKSM